MHSENLLTHAHGLTRVVCHSMLLEADERPELPFAFDALYYEPPTGLSFRVLAGDQIQLTPDEIAVCEDYCGSFLATADYPVHAFDTDGIYAGTMLKTEAVGKELAFRIAESPDHPASKWTGEKWERVVMSVLDDGTMIGNPEGICDRCVLALTAEEWAAFPQQPSSDNGEVWSWDFVAEVWRDVSDPVVAAFDDVGAYVGHHLRSTLREGWGHAPVAPAHQASVWTGDAWVRVAASIDDAGHVEIQPGGIRDEAILLFTRETWARWPSRPENTRGEYWVWDFRAEDWRDASNPQVAAYEPDGERAGVFAGFMMRSEAETAGLGWSRDYPGGPAAKWTGEKWEQVIVVVMDTGTVRHHPEAVCDKCMLALTADEWAAWPKPPHEIPESLGGWSWNFATEQWEDRREHATVRKDARNVVKARMSKKMFDELEDLEAGDGLPDMLELTMLAAEARTLSPGTPSPMLDAIAAGTGQDREVVAAKASENYATVAGIYARRAVQRAPWLNRIAACTDNAALDSTIVDLLAELRTELRTGQRTACGAQ